MPGPSPLDLAVDPYRWEETYLKQLNNVDCLIARLSGCISAREVLRLFFPGFLFLVYMLQLLGR